MKGKKWIAVLLILASVLVMHAAPADEMDERVQRYEAARVQRPV